MKKRLILGDPHGHYDSIEKIYNLLSFITPFKLTKHHFCAMVVSWNVHLMEV
jgi:hypothetical protein